MSDVRHIINIGAKTVVDIDGVYNPKKSPAFTFDRTDIKMDTTLRRFDETV